MPAQWKGSVVIIASAGGLFWNFSHSISAGHSPRAYSFLHITFHTNVFYLIAATVPKLLFKVFS